MATWNIRPITPVYWNESNRYVSYPLAAAQDFSKGAPVVLGTDGTISEAGADPALILGFATSSAAQANPADTFGYNSQNVPVALADQTFRGTLEGTYNAATDIGDQFGIVEDATGYWTVDRADTANVVVTVLDVGDDDVADGDVNPPVIFRVIDTVRQADS